MLLTCGHFWLLKNTVNTEYSRLGVKKKKKKICSQQISSGRPWKKNQNRADHQEATLERSVLHFFKKKKVKKFQPPEILEKCKSKSQWGITSHWSEWPLLKSLQTVKLGEAVEKRAPSYTDAGNVNWEQPPWTMRCMFLKQRKREWNYDNSLTPYKKRNLKSIKYLNDGMITVNLLRKISALI